jgi:hypothetical protein
MRFKAPVSVILNSLPGATIEPSDSQLTRAV